ncbi:MAG: Transcription initiation factor IIB [Candidatus Thorarchaeota archaeon]|nr:MAG: Transcription initiation factor IIB [Candidatus Thorarchaeota archaeon]
MGIDGRKIKDNRETVCTLCGGEEFYEDRKRGETICTSCGCVAGEGTIDTGPEWRAFTAEERESRERTGAPMSVMVADKGLSTTISWSNRDASGRPIKASTRASIYRMRKWQIRTQAHSSDQRNLRIALNELKRLSSQLGIPHETRERSALIYRKALSKKLARGRSIESVVAAAVYLACRIHKIPRRLDELADESRIDRKKLGQAVRLLIRYLDMKIPLPSAKNLIPRISADLGVQGRTIRRATDIIEDARQKGITVGKDPGGIAAAALYIAGIIEDDRRTQREIAQASNVTEVTVRNRYKELVKNLQITMDPSEGRFA